MSVNCISEVFDSCDVCFTADVCGSRENVPSSHWGTRPHMLRNKVVSRVMSKFFDETEEGMAGKSFPHCVALIILRVLKFCKAG